MLSQDHNRNVGVSARRHTHKPGVGARGHILGYDQRSGAVIDHLRRACLTRKVDVVQMRCERRTAHTRIKRPSHPIGDRLPYSRIDRKADVSATWIRVIHSLAIFRRQLVRLHDVGPLEHAPGGDPSDCPD